VTRYLELADYLLVAESVLGVPAELIADFNRIGLADSALAAPQAGFGGIEAYPDFATKAAVLCWHLRAISNASLMRYNRTSWPAILKAPKRRSPFQVTSVQS
jgi:hypothetical protein